MYIFHNIYEWSFGVIPMLFVLFKCPIKGEVRSKIQVLIKVPSWVLLLYIHKWNYPKIIISWYFCISFSHQWRHCCATFKKFNIKMYEWRSLCPSNSEIIYYFNKIQTDSDRQTCMAYEYRKMVSTSYPTPSETWQ